MKSRKVFLIWLFCALHAQAEQVTLVPSADTGLFEFAPDNNLGRTRALQIGTNGQGARGRGLFRFDVASQVPPGSRIDSVSISFTVSGVGGAGEPAVHDLYRVQLEWHEGEGGSGNHGSPARKLEATWDSRSHGSAQWTLPGGSPGADFASEASASEPIGGVGRHSFANSARLAQDVQGWLDDPARNYGWVLLSQEEGVAGSTRRIATRELIDSAPHLTVEFTPFRITGVTLADDIVNLSWQGGSPPFRIERSSSPSAENWTVVATTDARSADLDAQAARQFFRVREAPAAAIARYEATWKATWSGETHPSGFPDGGGFSPLVGVTHDRSFSLWEPGVSATAGIRQLAELGADTSLRNEILAAISSDGAAELLAGTSVVSPGETRFSFGVDQAHSLVSMVAAIRPSPDWFVGFRGVALFDEGRWLESKTVALQAYDAGTDSGLTYNSADEPTQPPIPIAPISPLGDTRPFGAVTFTRIE